MLYWKGLILFLHYLFDFSSFDEDPNLFLFPFGDFLRSANFLGFFADSSIINQRSREVGQEYIFLAAATAKENDGVIFFTNHHFITDWFVHTGVITYK